MTRVIGGRYREDFAGVEVAATARADRARGTASELLLPHLVRLRDAGRFRLKGYSVLVTRAAGAARRRRLEPDLRLLPQHRPRTSTMSGARCMSGGTRPSARLPGRGRRQAAAAGAPVFASTIAARARAGRRDRRGGDAPSAERRSVPGRRRAREALTRGMRELRARFAARALRRARHRLRGLPRRQPRARRRSARAARTSPRGARSWRARPEVARTDGRGDARRADQPRLRPLPPGAVLALSVHVGRGTAARRQRRAAARSPRARRATSCSAAARARCRA